jgi:hypothetical protein
MVRKAKAVELKFKAVLASNILRTLLENYALDNVILLHCQSIILSEPTDLQRIVNVPELANVRNIQQTCFLFLICPTYPNIS